VKEPKVRKLKTQTTPAGAEIPIPKRSDYLRDLETVSAPERKPSGHSKWSEIKRRKDVPPEG
jgi:hypothetical protein